MGHIHSFALYAVQYDNKYTPIDANYSLISVDILPGRFKNQFTEAGTYYFWSGYVDESQTKSYRMTVEVSEKQSFMGEVSALISGRRPVFNLDSGMEL